MFNKHQELDRGVMNRLGKYPVTGGLQGFSIKPFQRGAYD